MDVSPHPQSPVPSQQEGEGNGELGAAILPPNPEQLGSCLFFFKFFIYPRFTFLTLPFMLYDDCCIGKKAIGDGNGVVPASRATPEGGVACNLRQHR